MLLADIFCARNSHAHTLAMQSMQFIFTFCRSANRECILFLRIYIYKLFLHIFTANWNQSQGLRAPFYAKHKLSSLFVASARAFVYVGEYAHYVWCNRGNEMFAAWHILVGRNPSTHTLTQHSTAHK